ncbi:hypothetical protein Theos_1316 [Thermus oshimai JL-2]|uniref:Uncharacterized protein n=1 Tax=Thermus oshimai JL-2 TaxID=751945 RepID=K7RIY1_THEOS|nr:AAA family ATPase [Thermus oshimai]AFV76352.1 hypothetical protein Theos_1316 [Thermus oshimai JL-2]
MAVVRLALPPEPPEVAWGVEGLFPQGYVSLVFAHQGQGKTRLVSFLAVQAARPEGRGLFAKRRVAHGRVVILDADDPGGLGYGLWVNRFLKAYPDADRGLIDLRAVEGGLTPEDLAALEAELKEDPPAFIILDAFSSAFLGVDVIKPHQVHAPMRGLTTLAQTLGTTLILLDHVGKLLPGQSVAQKGALGSVVKLASPRAAFALERVPPKEVEGRDVVKLTCVKQSYGPLPPPIGLELAWLEEEEGCYFKPFPLPEGETLEERAEATILRLLEEAGEGGLPRKELLAGVVARANVSERTVLAALGTLRRRGTVEVVELGGRGSPKAYRLSGTPHRVVPVAQNGENALQNATDFVQRGLHEMGEDGGKTLQEGVYFVQSDGEGTSRGGVARRAAEDRRAALTARLLGAAQALSLREEVLARLKAWAEEAPLEALEAQTRRIEARLAQYQGKGGALWP